MAGVITVRKSAGERRHRVSLEQGTTVRDQLGGQSTTNWTSFGMDWAAIDETPFIVSESEASLLYKVSIRYRADVVTRFAAGGALRAVGGGKTLKVLQVENPEQRNRDLVLHCSDMGNAA